MRFLMLAGLLATSACSPYGFEKEIGEFSSGLSALSGAFDDNLNAARNDFEQRQFATYSMERPRIRVAASCGIPANALPTASPECQVVRLVPSSIESGYLPIMQGITRAATNTGPVLRALQKYANALEAITKASDRLAFDTASSQLVTSVGALSTALNLAVPGAGAILPAAVKAGTFLISQALDAERRKVISAQTHAVDPYMKSIAVVLGQGLEAISLARQGIVLETANGLAGSMNQSVPVSLYATRLEQVQGRITELNKLRRANPTQVAAALADAHHKLVEALDDPQRSLASLATAVTDFAEQAQDFQKAVSSSQGK